jgi:hypothetical protein
LEILESLAILAVLLGCSLLGRWGQRWLKDHHKTSPTTDAARAVGSIMVTISGLVLGLLISSSKTEFDDHAGTYRRYGIALVDLDHHLREYGDATLPIRTILRAYTAAVIASQWPDEPHPSGAYPDPIHAVQPGSGETAEFTAMMGEMDDRTQALAPPDPRHDRLATLLRQDLRTVEAIRWSLVERAQSELSPVLLGVLVGWLAAVFLNFGLTTPRNRVTAFALVLSAVSVASSLYLILDLNSPIGGHISIPSRPLRDALWHMDQP